MLYSKAGITRAIAHKLGTLDVPQTRRMACAIITTSANELLSPIHDRMPVILPRELESLWLNHDIQDYAALSGILTPYITDEMEAYEVSSLVNSPANDGPEMVVPVGQVRPCDGPALRLPL